MQKVLIDSTLEKWLNHESHDFISRLTHFLIHSLIIVGEGLLWGSRSKEEALMSNLIPKPFLYILLLPVCHEVSSSFLWCPPAGIYCYSMGLETKQASQHAFKLLKMLNESIPFIFNLFASSIVTVTGQLTYSHFDCLRCK